MFRASMDAAGKGDGGDLNEGYECITGPFDAGYNWTPPGGTRARVSANYGAFLQRGRPRRGNIDDAMPAALSSCGPSSRTPPRPSLRAGASTPGARDLSVRLKAKSPLVDSSEAPQQPAGRQRPEPTYALQQQPYGRPPEPTKPRRATQRDSPSRRSFANHTPPHYHSTMPSPRDRDSIATLPARGHRCQRTTRLKAVDEWALRL